MTVAPASAPVPQTGQEIIRQAKLRVLQRHYEDTLNQMIQLEKDALAAPPEEREKMEASAKAMREFLNKLESELLPLADGPKRVFTTPAIPDRSQRPVGSEILDPPKPAPAPIRAGSSDAAPTAEKPERLSHSPSTTPPATPGPQQSAPPSAIPLGADATKNDVEKYRAVFRRVFERELDRALTQKSPGSAATPPAVRDSAPLRIAPPALTAPKIDHFPIAPPKIEPLRELPPAKLESPKPLATSQASPAPVTSHPSAARPASDLAKMAYEEYLGAARERVDRAWQLYQAGGSSPEEFAAAQRDLAAARADSTKAAEARLAEVKQAYDAVFNKRWDAHVASSATPLMNPELEAAARRVVQATAELDAAKAGLTAPNVDVARPSDGQTKQLEGNTGNVTQEGIRGRVLAVNSRWDFTVISIGSKQGAAAKKTLVVSRNGQAIGKIRISSVEENQSIANIIPDSFIRGPRIQPGDDVVFIGDEKVEAETNRGTGAATGKVGM
jgi:hypothetical protein